MNGFNKVIVAGNLTRDPELRYTSTGRAVARISLAVNRKWRDPESGESKEEREKEEVISIIGRWLPSYSVFPCILEQHQRTTNT